MANNGGRRSSGSDNSSLILGILIGMVLGLLVAGAVAWHLSNRPKSFMLKDQREAPTEPAAAGGTSAKPRPAATAPQGGSAASGVAGEKPRFEFYRILTDKDNTAARNPSSANPLPKTEAKESPAASLFLQAGSFASAVEADRLKARLALMGMEAAVQPAEVPGKGTYYRVRLGPYRSTDELNKANTTLKQNGISNAAPVRGAH